MVEVKEDLTNINRKQPGLSSSRPVSVSPLFCDIDKHRLENILDNIPSAVIVIEKPDGVVTYANKRAIELHGMNPCGIPITQQTEKLRILTLEGDLCPTAKLYTYRALFNAETIRNKQFIIENLADGKRMIININAQPIYESNGNVNAAIAIFDNVTKHIKTQDALKESEERLKMAQQIAHVGSWEYRIKEDKAIWSEELFHIFGLKPDKYGPNIREYLSHIHPDDRELMTSTMGARGDPRVSFDYRIIREDGEVRTIHSQRVVRDYDENHRPLRVVGVEQDITERKQIEQKLEDYAKNLEHLVEERTKQLKNAERLAAIGQTAGMIGHDIRNPLQAISGELFLMKQDVDSSPDSECKRGVQESLASIQEQVDYMNKIISDLQDFARPLKPELVEVDLCSIIPQLVSTVQVPSNIRAQAECDGTLPKIKVDTTFLKRILVNLATNAVQAMPNGGILTIKASQQANKIAIAVSDTGIGIPDDIKPKIFQPLMTTKSKGQGFGLAVVKRLVEAQGGSITFESKVGLLHRPAEPETLGSNPSGPAIYFSR